MAELGLQDAAAALERATAKPKKLAQPAKKRVKVARQPARQSSRLQGQTATLEGVSDLALFQCNNECPRCGKASLLKQSCLWPAEVAQTTWLAAHHCARGAVRCERSVSHLAALGVSSFR